MMAEIYGFFFTARTWTLIFISFKIAYMALRLIGALCQLCCGGEDSQDSERGIDEAVEAARDEKRFHTLVKVWTSPLFLTFYGVSLYGILTENWTLITLYIVFLGLETLFHVTLLFFSLFKFGVSIPVILVPFLIVLLLHALPIMCALEFRRLTVL